MLFHFLLIGVVGREVLFVIVSKGGDHDCVCAELFLRHNTADEVRTLRDADSDAELLRQHF